MYVIINFIIIRITNKLKNPQNIYECCVCFTKHNTTLNLIKLKYIKFRLDSFNTCFNSPQNIYKTKN